MSSGGASAVRNTLIAMISRECRHFQDGITFDSTNLTQIPPFGTCDYDGNPTSITKATLTTGGADFPKSAAFAACHQFIGGKTGMTVNFGGETFDVVDLNDTIIPRQHYKGPRNFSGNLELWDGDIDLSLWLSTIQGDWDPAKLSYEDFPELRHFEFYILVSPLDANNRRALNLTATKADKLIRLYNVTFPTADLNMDNPLKMTVPFNFSLAKAWSNWTQPAQSTLLAIADVTAAGPFTGDTDVASGGGASNKVWTRLQLEIAGATVASNSIITVSGTSPLGNAIEEDIDVGTTPGAAFTRQTKSVFKGSFSVEFDSGFTVAGTCNVKDVDYGLTPTLDAPGGVPVTN